ncbi:nucleotide sugar dehydrogenase [Fervidobacterium sp.]
MKIAVAGLGYVGLSVAVLLAQHNEVVGYDVSNGKIELINQKISPINDKEIEEYLKTKQLNLRATRDAYEAFSGARYIVVATPTDYNPEKDYFDTSSVEEVVETALKINPDALIIIKSTVPIGFTENLRKRYQTNNIIFSPEFLREGKALYDNLYPARIIIGERSKRAEEFANLLIQGAIKKDIPVVYTSSTEAEAIKLFANAYLAMRIAFFNELDTFAEVNGLNTREIIEGVCLDPRIGNFYNNPSFGYGGYCLPKDTKQLLSHFKTIPNAIIKAIVESNELRKKHIAKMVMKNNPRVVGIYRLTAKAGTDNFRQAAIIDVINELKNNDVEILIYEPLVKDDQFMGLEVVNNLQEFKQACDLIIANRLTTELEDVQNKVYTRDLFGKD